MFRSKRSGLVKRLWKSRLRIENEAASSSESPEELEIKSVMHSMLKRLKEQQLAILVSAIESFGGERTGCVLVPRCDLPGVGRGPRGKVSSIAPHILSCQVWRWPDLPCHTSSSYYGDTPGLKPLLCCSTSLDDPSSVCVNPYHWSRIHQPDIPPPPYATAVLERVLNKDDSETGLIIAAVSTETGGTPSQYPPPPSGDSSQSVKQHWCNVAYWELRQRVGRLFSVTDDSVNIFQELPQGDGMCLKVMQQDCKSDSVRHTREKIGYGLTLSREPGGAVWVYNRSKNAIFVNTPMLDVPNTRLFTVCKVLPGYSMKIFDYDVSRIIEQTRDPESLDGPFDPNSIRISFAKGWGPSYSRQFVTSCPCWIEVLLSVNR